MWAALSRISVASALCVLAACDITGSGPSGPQVTSLALYDGSVTVTAPQNYCIASQASRPIEGFGVLVNCTTLRGDGNVTAPKGVVTIQVAQPGTALSPSDAAGLAALVQTDTGRALLSQSGTATDISVQSARQSGDTVLVRFVDAAPPPIAGLHTTEWRAFLAVNGRLATVAVRGLADAPLGTDEGAQLLDRVILALQSANAPAERPTDS